MRVEHMEIGRIRFCGPRYESHALDTLAFEELINLQAAVFKYLEIKNFKNHQTQRRLTAAEKDAHRLFLGDMKTDVAGVGVLAIVDRNLDIFRNPPAHQTMKKCMADIYAIVSDCENGIEIRQDIDTELLS